MDFLASVCKYDGFWEPGSLIGLVYFSDNKHYHPGTILLITMLDE